MQTTEVVTGITIKNILVATDLSATSEKALRAAGIIAQRYGAEVVIAHILEPAIPTVISLDGADVLSDRIRHEASEELARLKTLTAGIHPSVLLREGPIWDELLNIIQERHIDLVVLGTHGASGVEKLALGSIAEEVFRRASCPVLTVGPGVTDTGKQAGDLRSIVYPTDFSSQAREALPYALSLAAQHKADLTLLHVEEKFKELTPAERTIASYRFKSQLQKLVADEGGASIPAHYELAYGDPAEAILEVVREKAADLVVLGVQQDSGFARFLPWSVASRIVRHATCPVLTIRES